MQLAGRIKVGICLLCILFVLVLLGRMVLPISSFGPTAYQVECDNNLKNIIIGLYEYHQDNSSLPPAYIADAKGNRMHSWRVLLLKYLDKALYDAYDFSEPWDGPKNRNLLEKMPLVYSCPNYRAQGNAKTTFTNYLAVTGPNSPFAGNKSKSMSEVAVGTILITEIVNPKIHWMEPRDLDVSQIDLGPKSWDSFRSRIGSNDPWGPGVILGDLRIVRIR